MKFMKAAILSLSALVVLALVDGCNFAPAYHEPAVSTPAAFKETNSWKTAQPSDGVIKGNWWEAFNDPKFAP